MIKTFKQKELKKFFTGERAKLPQFEHRVRVRAILDALNAAPDVEVMNYPGARFHKLEPPTAGRYAVAVSGNWRICFVFRDGDAYEVEYVDYH